MKYFLYLVLIALVGCGSTPAPEPESQAEAPAPAPPDESRRFPKEGQTSMDLVQDNLLGKDFLPGGNVAAYDNDGQRYQLFLAVTADPEAAARLSFDVKENLEGSRFVASFGGYFGMDGETPWFVFAKTNHLLGVVGLPFAEADLVARDFAARVQ